MIYSPDRFKKGNETFRQFVKRTERAIEKVKKAGVLLSDDLKGLHLLSHLRLTTQQFELLVQWTLKDWSWDKIVAALERYESEPLVGPNYTKGHTHREGWGADAGGVGEGVSEAEGGDRSTNGGSVL